VATIILPSSEIVDRKKFHSVCQRVFGFPAFYAQNMDAWIDCMSYLDDPEASMSSITLTPGELLLITLPDSEALKERAPEVFTAFIECSAIVNRRFVTRGHPPLIGLLLA
jgi:RNAse (barnase) inhibitor barstar